MNLHDEARRIHDLVVAAERAGAEAALVEVGLLKAWLTQRQMHRRFGRKKVELWETLKLVKCVRQGANTSSIMYSRAEANQAFMTDIILALPVKEVLSKSHFQTNNN